MTMESSRLLPLNWDLESSLPSGSTEHSLRPLATKWAERIGVSAFRQAALTGLGARSV